MQTITNEQLKEFWATYIKDSGEVWADSITQIFMQGPFAGYSIREIMELAVIRLGKQKPKIVYDENY